MNVLRNILVLILLYTTATSWAEPHKQALKFLDEGDYERAEEQVRKILEKDARAPGGHYLYGRLYFEESFSRFNLDSAYYYVTQAQSLWKTADEKTIQKIVKAGIMLVLVEELRESVEWAAYRSARASMTLEAFDVFFDRYDNDQLDGLLLVTRDSLAFTEVQAMDTWQAYQQFINDYPEAIQRELAYNAYHERIYEDRALNQPVASLRTFLVEIADTPYRDQIEYELLKGTTLSGLPRDFQAFLNDYPLTVHAPLVTKYLYHLGITQEDYQFPARLLNDSIRQEALLAADQLFPYMDDGKFGFFDAENGREVIRAQYDAVAPRYLCAPTLETLLQVTINGRPKVVTRSGVALSNSIAKIDPLGGNVFKYSRGDLYGCMLASGEEILPAQYDDVQLIDGRLLAVAKDDQWGVYSLMGTQLLPLQYDEIGTLTKGVVTIWKDDRIALFSFDKIDGQTGVDAQLRFLYEEVELMGEELIWCFADDREQLLDAKLGELIPLADHQIYEEEAYIYAESGGTVKIYDPVRQTLGDEVYQDIMVGKGRVALRKNDRWNLLMDNNAAEPRLQIDSVYFPNDRVSVIVQEESRTLLFDDQVAVEVPQDAYIESVKNAVNDLKTAYFSVKDESGEIAVIAPDGVQLFAFEGTNVEMAADSLFLVREKKGMLLKARNGENVLSRSYDLIEPAVEDGRLVFHLLRDGKLGMYGPEGSLSVRPAYSEKVRVVSDSVFVAVQDDLAGIVKTWTEGKTAFIYQEVTPLNDSLLLVKEDDVWSLINVLRNETLLSDIISLDEEVDYGGFRQRRFKQSKGFGLLDSRKGILLEGRYLEISNIGTQTDPYIFVERYLEDAEFYVVLYLNKEGEKVKSIAYKEAAYEKILCDQ